MVNVEYHEHSKKTKSKARKIKLQTASAKRAVRQQERKQEEAVPLFPAIQVRADDGNRRRGREAREMFYIVLGLYLYIIY